jgi:hypothetical protein
MTTTPEVPSYGGCLWPYDTACTGTAWDTLSDPSQRDRALALASSTLHRLTGGRVGECPITVRPCKPGNYAQQTHLLPQYQPFHPTIDRFGAWVNIGCCSNSNCACDVACSVLLPRPVTRVDEVRIDGQVIDPANYFVSGGDRLVWAGSEPCPFRATQDLSKPDTEPGTFSVTYLNTYPVDSVAACAVGTLAGEFAKAFSGAKGCRLPGNVTAISRQGVSMELITGAFPNGLTGIREVDAFIALWNPTGMVAGPRVWSPDLGRTR